MDSWGGSFSQSKGAPSADNIAEVFHPTIPMSSSGVNPQKIEAKGDIPAKLRRAVAKGVRTIDHKCLKENATILLGVFENICLRHVLDQQIKGKDLLKLTNMQDPEVEQRDALTTRLAGSVIAKSSLIGQDPWGDKEVPEPDVEDEDGNEEYSRERLLLTHIQDKNYLYLTAHVHLILAESILTVIRKREFEYKLDTNKIRTNSARQRMPWSEYRELILDRLPINLGRHDMCLWHIVVREDGETAQNWVLRLRTGRNLLTQFGHTVSEASCVEKLMERLMKSELQRMTDHHLRENIAKPAARRRELSPAVMRKVLRTLSWEEMCTLINESIPVGSVQKYRQSMHAHLLEFRCFDLRSAANYLEKYGNPYTRNSAGNTAPRKRKRGSNRKPKCALCTEAGLSGKWVEHPTAQCNPTIREKNVARKKKLAGRRNKAQRTERGSGDSRKRKRDGQLARAPEKRDKDRRSCSLCKKAGRKHDHPQAKCFYQKGGIWHGLQGEELNAAKKNTLKSAENEELQKRSP